MSGASGAPPSGTGPRDVPPPGAPPDPGMAGVLHRNIAALVEVRRQFDREKRASERIADAVTGFAGSMGFVLLHAVILGAWLVINLGGIPWIRPFDRFPFVLLAMAASVEAIFLSTFILISQNRMAEMADRRADLDLQISLLAEHEVTRLIEMTEAVAQHLRVPVTSPEVQDLKRDVDPRQVVAEIAHAEQDRRRSPG